MGTPTRSLYPNSKPRIPTGYRAITFQCPKHVENIISHSNQNSNALFCACYALKDVSGVSGQIPRGPSYGFSLVSGFSLDCVFGPILSKSTRYPHLAFIPSPIITMSGPLCKSPEHPNLCRQSGRDSAFLMMARLYATRVHLLACLGASFN